MSTKFLFLSDAVIDISKIKCIYKDEDTVVIVLDGDTEITTDENLDLIKSKIPTGYLAM